MKKICNNCCKNIIFWYIILIIAEDTAQQLLPQRFNLAAREIAHRMLREIGTHNLMRRGTSKRGYNTF